MTNSVPQNSLHFMHSLELVDYFTVFFIIQWITDNRDFRKSLLKNCCFTAVRDCMAIMTGTSHAHHFFLFSSRPHGPADNYFLHGYLTQHHAWGRGYGVYRVPALDGIYGTKRHIISIYFGAAKAASGRVEGHEGVSQIGRATWQGGRRTVKRPLQIWKMHIIPFQYLRLNDWGHAFSEFIAWYNQWLSQYFYKYFL